MAPLVEACGRPADAEGLLRETWDFDRTHLPVNHPRLMDSALAYAASLSSHHRMTDAEAVLRELAERYRRKLPARSWRSAVVKMRLGSIDATVRRFKEAEQRLLEANASLALAFDRSDWRFAE